MLAMPKDPAEMIPVHFARHLRAKKTGDQKSADKYAKRMVDLIEPGNMWHIIWLYASGNTRLTSVLKYLLKWVDTQPKTQPVRP